MVLQQEITVRYEETRIHHINYIYEGKEIVPHFIQCGRIVSFDVILYIE